MITLPEVTFTVPLVPPSVNHYKRRKMRRRVIRVVLTDPAIAFKAAVAVMARGRRVVLAPGERYWLDVRIFYRRPLDGDNCWKLIADGLIDAGTISDDRHVRRWHLDIDRDPDNPRTEITVKKIAGGR